MNVFDYSEEELRLLAENTYRTLAETISGTEAVLCIQKALQQFTIYDLQTIGANIRFDVEKLPEPYRSRYRPYSTDLLDKYHEFFSTVRTGCSFEITDTALWKEYWQTASEQILIPDTDENSLRPCSGSPAGKLFYRLVFGYVMLIAGKPGHPVGTPFPGGWKVREENGVIVCPIRDKEKDLPQALCNFCPAVQDEEYK